MAGYLAKRGHKNEHLRISRFESPLAMVEQVRVDKLSHTVLLSFVDVASNNLRIKREQQIDKSRGNTWWPGAKSLLGSTRQDSIV